MLNCFLGRVDQVRFERQFDLVEIEHHVSPPTFRFAKPDNAFVIPEMASQNRFVQIDVGVRLSTIGCATIRVGPRTGESTVAAIPRCCTCGSSKTSFIA